MNILAYIAGSLDGYNGKPFESYDTPEIFEDYRRGFEAGKKYRQAVREVLGK